MNQKVYQLENKYNAVTKGLVYLNEANGILHCCPESTLDLYNKSVSVEINAIDLGVMGATLANHGVNPITKESVLDKKYIKDIISHMMVGGLYDQSGLFFYHTGLPGKSGVGGGIMAVVPAKMAIAVFSQPLNKSGNSIRGIKAVTYLSNKLKLSIIGY